MEREACVCDHGLERSDLCAEIITDRATWDIANQNIFCVLFCTTSGSAFSVVRRFEGKRLQDGPGHSQQAWVSLYEKFDGCSREALRAERHKMDHTKMAPGQDLDEFLHIMDSYRDRLNRSIPPEGPTNRQCKTFYCKPCRQIAIVLEEPTSKGGTLVLPIFDE